MDLTITKTVGVVSVHTGEKDFDIHLSNGEVVRAVRSGQKFSVENFTGTLKQCKDEVLAGLGWGSDDNELLDDPKQELGSSWDCIDPCAILVSLLSGRKVDTEFINETLNNYGWITPEGEYDVESASRQVHYKVRQSLK